MSRLENGFSEEKRRSDIKESRPDGEITVQMKLLSETLGILNGSLHELQDTLQPVLGSFMDPKDPPCVRDLDNSSPLAQELQRHNLNLQSQVDWIRTLTKRVNF